MTKMFCESKQNIIQDEMKILNLLCFHVAVSSSNLIEGETLGINFISVLSSVANLLD
jgi:hypothetical protein